jgi:hypothetical protein
MTISPLIGPGFSTVLFAQDKYIESAKFTVFKLNLGISGDVEITNDTFLRTELIGQYRYEPSVFKRKDRLNGDYSGYGFNVRIAAGKKL